MKDGCPHFPVPCAAAWFGSQNAFWDSVDYRPATNWAAHFRRRKGKFRGAIHPSVAVWGICTSNAINHVDVKQLTDKRRCYYWYHVVTYLDFPLRVECWRIRRPRFHSIFFYPEWEREREREERGEESCTDLFEFFFNWKWTKWRLHTSTTLPTLHVCAMKFHRKWHPLAQHDATLGPTLLQKLNVKWPSLT